MSKSCCGILVIVLLVGACSPDHYQRSADLQVQALLKDRGQQTLGYTPQVDAAVTVDAKPTRKSYDKVPVTPVPPATQPAIEPGLFEIPYARLGPEELFAPGMTSPRHVPLSIEEARRPALERLKLWPPSAPSNSISLDLFGAIEYAIQHSREYQSQMEDLYLGTLDVTLQRHLFSPRPFARSGVEYSGEQLDVGYRAALNVTNSVGIRQQLPYGGEIVAQGLFDVVNALTDGVTGGESAQLALSGTIPLLRGAGMVNLEPLIDSERNLVYQVRSFEEFRRTFVVSIASQYFRLLTQQQAISNRRFNYISSYRTTEQSLAVYGAGRPGANFLSVQRAASALFQAENNIITAEDSYQSSLDDFKIVIGMPVDQPLQIIQVEVSIPPPDPNVDAIALALKYRLDLQTANDRIEDARRTVANAKNGLLPDVNLTARGTVGNREDTPGRALDIRTADYAAGVNIDWPLDRLAERNSYRRALISLEQANRSWRTTHDAIIAQVRDAVRSIRSAQATLQIQQRDIDNNRQRLEYATEQLVLGRATDSQQAVDAQNNLLSAQDRYDQARANYYIQILSFLRDTGTLRINPDAGSLGMVMDRGRTPPKNNEVLIMP